MSQTKPTSAEATKYAESFILYGDKTKAFRAAFSQSKASAKTTNERASCFHKINKVHTRIGELQGLFKSQAEEEFLLTAIEIKQHLVKVVDMGLNDKVDAQGNRIPVSLPSVISAISEINRMDGNHAPVKAEEIRPRKEIDPSDLAAIRALIVSDE